MRKSRSTCVFTLQVREDVLLGKMEMFHERKISWILIFHVLYNFHLLMKLKNLRLLMFGKMQDKPHPRVNFSEKTLFQVFDFINNLPSTE